MKFWYKKNKIALHDISLIKQEGPKGAYEEVLESKIIESLIDHQMKSLRLNWKKKYLQKHMKNGHKNEEKSKELQVEEPKKDDQRAC